MLTIELRACRIDRETAKKLFLLHGHKSVYVCKQCIIIRDIFQQNTKFEPLIQVRVFTRRSVPVFRYGFAKNKQKNFGFAEVKKLFYVLIFVLFWFCFFCLLSWWYILVLRFTAYLDVETRVWHSRISRELVEDPEWVLLLFLLNEFATSRKRNIAQT